MAEKTIIDIKKPQTQTVPAVCALLAWKGRSSNPLPQFVEIGSGEERVVLVLSNKQDSYYTVTRSDCSCPASVYHRGPCKHRRKYFAEEQQTTTKPEAAIRQPNHGAWHGHNGPIAPDETRAAKAAAPSFELMDCLPDANNREIAYWSIQEDKILWPVEA